MTDNKACPSSFEIGDKYYECEMGINIECTVCSKPECIGDGTWVWTALDDVGNRIDYRWTEGISDCYGPRLYTSPQYCRIVGGVPVFVTSNGAVITA